MKIGAVIPKNREIVLNEGKKSRKILVKHTGDRPVQVGSHFHFFEVNKQLLFDRERRMDIIWIFRPVRPSVLNRERRRRCSLPKWEAPDASTDLMT